MRQPNFFFNSLIAMPFFFLSTMSCQAFDYEQAYEKTPVDQVEIKTVPRVFRGSSFLLLSGALDRALRSDRWTCSPADARRAVGWFPHDSLR